MSLTIFLALSILGCDFLLFVLFQWVYGEKRNLRHIRSLRQADREGNSSKLRVVSLASDPLPRRSYTPLLSSAPRSHPASPEPTWRRERNQGSTCLVPSRTREQLAYRRIAASFVPTRSRS